MTDATVVPAPDMKRAPNEAALVQNEALGAALIWRFVRGANSAAMRPCPIPACFIVLPIVFHVRLRAIVLSTQKGSGLRKFEEKLQDCRDDLLTVQPRMIDMRELSLRSLAIATDRRLIAINVDIAGVESLRNSFTRRQSPEAMWPLVIAAERLGGWCGAGPLAEVAAALRLAF